MTSDGVHTKTRAGRYQEEKRGSALM